MDKFLNSIKSLIDVSNQLFEARSSSVFVLNYKPKIELSYNDDETVAYLNFDAKADMFAFMYFIDVFLPGSAFSISGRVLTVFSCYSYDPNFL